MQIPQQCKLFVGLLTNEVFLFDEIKQELNEIFGQIDLEGPVWPWQHTDYYLKDMGDDLKRKFLFFKNLIRPEDISRIKINTMDIEQRFLRKDGGRRVNIDPGYIDFARVVLVSSKDFSHRLYLGHGIYAEVALSFVKKGYQPLPYTYPDFRSAEYIELFGRARELYSAQIKRGQSAQA